MIYSINMDDTLIKKYHSQYNDLIIKINYGFYDRFIIIDDTMLYYYVVSFRFE